MKNSDMRQATSRIENDDDKVKNPRCGSGREGGWRTLSFSGFFLGSFDSIVKKSIGTSPHLIENGFRNIGVFLNNRAAFVIKQLDVNFDFETSLYAPRI